MNIGRLHITQIQTVQSYAYTQIHTCFILWFIKFSWEHTRSAHILTIWPWHFSSLNTFGLAHSTHAISFCLVCRHRGASNCRKIHNNNAEMHQEHSNDGSDVYDAFEIHNNERTDSLSSLDLWVKPFSGIVVSEIIVVIIEIILRPSTAAHIAV